MFVKGHDYKGNKISPMQLIMLVLLWKGSMYGYEVLKELRDRFEGVWTPQTGSISLRSSAWRSMEYWNN